MTLLILSTVYFVTNMTLTPHFRIQIRVFKLNVNSIFKISCNKFVLASSNFTLTSFSRKKFNSNGAVKINFKELIDSRSQIFTEGFNTIQIKEQKGQKFYKYIAYVY